MFDKLAGKLQDIASNGLPVKITENMMELAMKQQEKVTDAKVKIADGEIIISGKTEVKKVFVKKDVAFEAVLRPIELKGRKIECELVKVKPLDLNAVNNKLLNKPPFVAYSERTVSLDLEAWEVVKKVPVGKLKDFSVDKGAITVVLGI